MLCIDRMEYFQLRVEFNQKSPMSSKSVIQFTAPPIEPYTVSPVGSSFVDILSFVFILFSVLLH